MSKFFDGYDTKEPIIFDECDNPTKNKIFRDTINSYHSYMKAKDTCNRRINWLVHETVSGNLIAAVGINSAILAMAERDKFIGWHGNKTLRLAGLNKLANNYRFCLIRDNLTIKNAGSQVLRKMRILGAKIWNRKYGDELVMIETLVHNDWSGSVYLADNWRFVGMTLGVSFSKAPLKLWQQEKSARGELARNDPKAAITKYAVGGKMYDITASTPKKIFIKPLVQNWKEILLKDA
jgi:hypothetical protein